MLGARLRLTPGDPAAIRRRMDDLMARRQASLSRWSIPAPAAPSSGRRATSPGHSSNRRGLKGLTVGGAQVSDQSTRALSSTVGGATSADVEELIRQVQQAVYAAHGVHLEPEVRIVR